MKNDCLQYISTRGHQKKLKFHDVIFEGLAPDGGLYIPESWPILEKSIISLWNNDYLKNKDKYIKKYGLTYKNDKKVSFKD